ncbi:restriction endonuclease subunit S [Gemmatimonas sp.]|uniref:restriction endonuclease subunit S n=1 Tax=Gemmatimonas sp. TaxID=1962908 RepID=UPI003341B2DC
MNGLPIGWSETTLGDIAVWSSGGTPSRAEPSLYSGTIPWFKTGELGPRVLYESEEHISQSALAKSSAKIFPKGSVALAMYGATIGRTSILGVEAATNQACAVAIPQAVSAEFLHSFLVSQERAFAEAGLGGAQPNISQGIVKAWPVSLPPANEQTRIVSKLEELLSDLDAGVAELKAAQRKLARYRQSLLKAAVEGSLTAEWRQQHTPAESGAQLLESILAERRARWEAKQLAKFKEQGKTPPKDWQQKYPEPTKPDATNLPELPEGWVWAKVHHAGNVQLGRQRAPQFHTGANMVPYLRVANVFEDRIDVSDVMEMHFSEAEEDVYRLHRNDILLNEGQSLELIGRSALFRDELPRACFTNTLVRFRVEEGVIPDFALALFLHYMHSGRFRKIASITTNIAHLGAGRFAEVEFPLPSTEEQAAIVSKLSDSLSSLKDQQRTISLALKQATAQRQNILRAAFAGELVPQDPNDEPASVLLERICTERAAAAARPSTPRAPRGRPTKA